MAVVCSSRHITSCWKIQNYNSPSSVTWFIVGTQSTDSHMFFCHVSLPKLLLNIEYVSNNLTIWEYFAKEMFVSPLHMVWCMMTSSNGNIPRSPVNSPHKGQWRGSLMFSSICAWINGWVNSREAGDLIRHRTHYDRNGEGKQRSSMVVLGVYYELQLLL